MYSWGYGRRTKEPYVFTKKNGFVAFDTHTFVLGSDAQTDILMKLSMF